MYQDSPLVPIFCALSRSLHRHSSVAQRPPSYHPSSLTSVYLVPVLHSYFHHQYLSGHTVLIHSFHMPKPSQYHLICSLANFLSIPALLRTSSFLPLSIYDTKTKLLKHFISRTFTFLLSALLIPHASAPYKAVGAITPSYRHFLAFIPKPLLLKTLCSSYPCAHTPR